MTNKLATFKVSLSYPGSGGETVKPPDVSVAAPFSAGAFLDGGVDIPDTTAASTEYALSFGSIAAATGLIVENQTGQDLHVKLNGGPAAVTGTLVAGTKTLALASVTGEKLCVALATSHGTPGILSVRRSGGNVIVESWLAGTGLQASDISDIIVHNGGSPQLFRLPDGGVMAIAAPAAPGSSALASASVVTTGTQAGAGAVAFKVFGDPV